MYICNKLNYMKLKIYTIALFALFTINANGQKSFNIGVSGGLCNTLSTTLNENTYKIYRTQTSGLLTYTAGLDLGYTFNDTYTLSIGGNVFNYANTIRINHRIDEQRIPEEFKFKNGKSILAGQLQLTNDMVILKKEKFSISALLGLNLNFAKAATDSSDIDATDIFSPPNTYTQTINGDEYKLNYWRYDYAINPINYQLFGGLSFKYLLGEKFEIFLSPKFYLGLNQASAGHFDTWLFKNNTSLGARSYSITSKADAIVAVAGLRFKIPVN